MKISNLVKLVVSLFAVMGVIYLLKTVGVLPDTIPGIPISVLTYIIKFIIKLIGEINEKRENNNKIEIDIHSSDKDTKLSVTIIKINHGNDADEKGDRAITSMIKSVN